MADDEMEALAATWGEDNLAKAFVLQQYIKKHGLEGIDYMKKARARLESTKHTTVKSTIEGEMDDSY